MSTDFLKVEIQKDSIRYINVNDISSIQKTRVLGSDKRVHAVIILRAEARNPDYIGEQREEMTCVILDYIDDLKATIKKEFIQANKTQ